MRPMKEHLNRLSDAAVAAGEAVSSAGDTCFTIVAGQLAGLACTCLDKFFLTEERHSTRPKKKSESSNEPISLSRKKAEKMAEKLSQHVSTPPDPTAPVVEE